MIILVAWLLIYSSVFIAAFYLSLYGNIKGERDESAGELENHPSVSVLMPAYNEEGVVEEAIRSVKELDYPNYSLKFVDDGSTDSTLEKAREHESENVEVISHEENQGKAAALNTGLEETDSEYIIVQDADSKISTDLLNTSIYKLENDSRLGAVIAAIKPLRRDNFIRKIQSVEYQVMNFFRMLMTEMNTLNVTPGAFSTYRTSDVKEVGGFDVGNPTEDLEMAFNLRKHGKNFEMIYFSSSLTDFPSTLKQLYDQRVRWARGFIHNAFKYREMFLNREYGYFGTFQLPMLVVMPALIVTSFVMVFIGISQSFYSAWLQYSAIGLQLPEFGLGNLWVGLLGANLSIYGPLVLSLVLVAYVIYTAYRYAGEKPSNVPALMVYFFTYFLLQSGFWMAAVLKELLGITETWT